MTVYIMMALAVYATFENYLAESVAMSLSFVLALVFIIKSAYVLWVAVELIGIRGFLRAMRNRYSDASIYDIVVDVCVAIHLLQLIVWSPLLNLSSMARNQDGFDPLVPVLGMASAILLPQIKLRVGKPRADMQRKRFDGDCE